MQKLRGQLDAEQAVTNNGLVLGKGQGWKCQFGSQHINGAQSCEIGEVTWSVSMERKAPTDFPVASPETKTRITGGIKVGRLLENEPGKKKKAQHMWSISASLGSQIHSAKGCNYPHFTDDK